MISRTISLICLLALCAGLATADVIRKLEANPSGNSMVVTWESIDETGVAYYIIERAQRTGTYVTIISHFPAKGSGQRYQFNDETAFKTTDDTWYNYRVTPCGADGNFIGSDRPWVTAFTKTSTGVHRTWGSIKAMFR